MSQKEIKVGVVKFTDHASLNRIEIGIKKGLDELAKKHATPITYDGLVHDGQADTERMKEIGHQLAAKQPDLVITIATPTTVALKPIMESAGIPILFRAVSDPISAKVINSFAHPGEFITGTSDSLDGAELAEVMLKILPDIKKVGLLYGTEEISSKMPIEEAKAFLSQRNIAFPEATPTKKDEVADAAKELIAKGVEAVFTPTDNTVMSAEMEISPILTDAGIPQFTGSHAFTLTGAFLGLGTYYRDSDRMFLAMAEELLFYGKKPNDMPVARNPHAFAAINKRVCDALGFDRAFLKTAIGELGKDTLFLDEQEEFDPDSNL